MEVFLESIASRKLEWLAIRQAAVADNIANANTPAFKAKDVTPFSAVLDNTELALASTSAGHLAVDENNSIGKVGGKADTWEVTDSGNSVGLENELIKAANINQQYKLTTNIMKAFDAMFSSALKG
jgi:flagellar basal-body rod protein FlgB